MRHAPRTTLKNATFRVPKAIWQRAKQRAVGEERSLNDVVVGALEAYAGVLPTRGAKLLADAARFVKARGHNQPARSFTKAELHEDDSA